MDMDKIRELAKKELEKNDLVHGWEHTRRVCELSKKLGKEENADLEVLEFAALLHDVGIHESRKKHGEKSADIARDILKNYDRKEKVIDCIRSHRFGNSSKSKSIETKVLQDADMLDAIGAIGIIRAAYFSGLNERSVYDSSGDISEEYDNRSETMIDHFHEKLLKIKERLNTSTAKKLAEDRHEFMKNFLTQFFKEWEVKDLE